MLRLTTFLVSAPSLGDHHTFNTDNIPLPSSIPGLRWLASKSASYRPLSSFDYSNTHVLLSSSFEQSWNNKHDRPGPTVIRDEIRYLRFML